MQMQVTFHPVSGDLITCETYLVQTCVNNYEISIINYYIQIPHIVPGKNLYTDLKF